MIAFGCHACARAAMAPSTPAANTQDTERAAAETAGPYQLSINGSPVQGPPTAAVTLVIFSDFSNGHLALVEDGIQALRSKYGDKLRFVWKNRPSHANPLAEAAAEAALEVRAGRGDVGFWQAHDTLFFTLKERVNASTPEATAIDEIVAAGARAGARPGDVRNAIVQHTHRRDIEADEDLRDDFPILGTVFVNGYPVKGVINQDTIEASIEAHLHDGDRLPAGTPDVYAALIQGGMPRRALPKKSVPASLPTADPARGNPESNVTVHEWCSFIPACQGAEETLKLVMRDYGDRVRLVWHDAPPSFAELPTEAAREALTQKGPDGFWAMHDKIFVVRTAHTRSQLEKYARALELDMDRFATALDGNTHQEEVAAGRRAADEIGLGPTPAFLIVPRNTSTGYVAGLVPYSRFRRLIERSLREGAWAASTDPVWQAHDNGIRCSHAPCFSTRVVNAASGQSTDVSWLDFRAIPKDWLPIKEDSQMKGVIVEGQGVLGRQLKVTAVPPATETGP
jgi:protein-disulfide isomerase